ncbi:MAG: RNA-binding protein [Oscillospiraceae bacterium]|nr:RNA-binding protein [Oscillospiraceae bacterium]
MKSEKDLIPARTEDMIRQSSKINSPVYSMFLDEKQCFEAEEVCRKYPDVRYKFWGGYPEAQRKILCVYSLNGCDYLDELYSENLEKEAPLRCLTFTYRKSDELSHRDFLGSLMAMRLKRETIGDIVVSEGKTQIFLTDTASELIFSTVSKIGKTGVKIYNDIPFDIEKVQEFEYISGTVSSMRADSIISLAIKISREKTSQIIKNAGVQINFTPVFSSSYEMKCNDVFSVKGYGRFILSEITGLSKKGRIRITIKKYK